ncbi:phosphoglycerate mutase [Opitutaceae bacterium TAV5]|nr:phosphoglycerate mutase [Opitutaceae bacterium TAV5]
MNNLLPHLYLVRHGETAWSLAGRHTGRSELPLTGQGELESRLLGERLAGAVFSHVFTSPRLRARRTCELSGLGAGATIEPDLAEWDYGDYEGKRASEIREERPDWDIFRDGCPGGETPAQVSDRADRLLARLRQLRGDIALFTHGHFGRVLGVRWIGLPLAQARHFLLGTASLSVLGHEHGRDEEPAIALWGAVSGGLLDAGRRLRENEAGILKQRAIERWENEGGEIPGLPANHQGNPDAL